MDCLFTALMVSSANGSRDSDAGESNRCFRRKRASRNPSSCLAEEDHTAVPHLKRRRAAAFFLSFYVCAVKMNEKVADGSVETLEEMGMCEGQQQSIPSTEKKEVLHWCEEKISKRRKIGGEEWLPAENSGSIFCRAPARLKRLLKLLRAKVRKMRQAQKAASFHYDPLSYAMNFDDGYWRQSDTHAKVFGHSPHLELFCPSEAPLKDSSTFGNL